MDKESRIKYDEICHKLYKSNATLKELGSFLSKHSNIFKKQESIEALKRIKDYYLKIEKEYDKLKEEYHNSYKNLMETCKHEIVKKDDYNCTCVICGNNFINIKNIPQTTNLMVDTSKQQFNDVDKIICSAIYTDGNFIDIVETELEDYQYKSNIKVYRR